MYKKRGVKKMKPDSSLWYLMAQQEAVGTKWNIGNFVCT